MIEDEEKSLLYLESRCRSQDKTILDLQKERKELLEKIKKMEKNR